MNVISLVLWAAMAAQQVTGDDDAGKWIIPIPECPTGMICELNSIGHGRIGHGCATCGTRTDQAQPMDVAAIRLTEDRFTAKGRQFVGDWTCADKQRILLTSEDGAKHCILFQKSPNP